VILYSPRSAVSVPTYKAISVWIVMEVAVQNVAEPALAVKNQVRDVRRTFTQIMSLENIFYTHKIDCC